MKITLYTDRSFLPEGKKYTTLLFPFWGNPETDKNDSDYGRFDEYTAKGKDFFSLTDDPQSADYFLLPYEFSFLKNDMIKSEQLEELAKKHNKKIIVFFNSDSDQDIPVENAIVFRTSFFKSSRKANEFAFPGWSIDFMKLKEKNESNEGSKPEKPSISYCGYIDHFSYNEVFSISNLIKKIKSRWKSADKIGPAIRGKAVRLMVKDKRITTNFIIRNGFWAPGMDKKQARNEYVDNIFRSDYALVARGAGNFSYRLFEVLSCGKIPVFINTDSVLPFDHIIDWKKYMVWIDEKDINQIAGKLVSFHERLSDREFGELKKNCRNLYEEWVSPSGFFSGLYKCLN